MTHTSLRPAAAAALLLCSLLAACGGGNEGTSASVHEQAFAAAPVSDRVQVLATTGRETSAVAVTITNDQLFAWAAKTYPTLFPGTAQKLSVDYEGKTYDVRFFAATGNYLGISGGEAYGLGPFTGNVLQGFGVVQSYATTVCADGSCTSSGGGGGGSTGNGTLNDCIDPASGSLPAGFRLQVVYTYSGVITGEQTVETVIGSSASFEGQTATLSTSTTRGTNTISAAGQTFTVPTTTVVKSYQQPAGNGLLKTLGAETEATIGGITFSGVKLPDTVTKSKTVFDPAELNSEFTLQVGQNVTKNTTIRTTLVSGTGATTSVSSATTYTYEARESVTVPAGTYNTCRYKTTTAAGDTGTVWYIVGKGVPARTESRTSGGTQLIQLKSGNYNGAAL